MKLTSLNRCSFLVVIAAMTAPVHLAFSEENESVTGAQATTAVPASATGIEAAEDASAPIPAEPTQAEPIQEAPVQEAPVQEAPQSAALKERKLGDAFRRFQPSEEISADNAVPFPVDI